MFLEVPLPLEFFLGLAPVNSVVGRSGGAWRRSRPDESGSLWDTLLSASEQRNALVIVGRDTDTKTALNLKPPGWVLWALQFGGLSVFRDHLIQHRLVGTVASLCFTMTNLVLSNIWAQSPSKT